MSDLVYASRAVIPTSSITPTVQAIRVLGCDSSGDGGGADYKHGSSSGPMAIQDANGQWWELANPTQESVLAFGASTSAPDNSAAFTRAATTGVINAPAGNFQFTNSINSDRELTFRGAGKALTRLHWTGSSDGLRHQQNGTHGQGDFMLKGVQLFADQSGPNVGIRITMDHNRGNVIIDDVGISGSRWEWNWQHYMVMRGCTHTMMTNCDLSKGAPTDSNILDTIVQDGILIYSSHSHDLDNQPGSADGSYVNLFVDCSISAVQHAVHVILDGTPGNSGTVEGVQFFNCGGDTVRSSWFRLENTSGGSWAPPYYLFDSCNMEAPGSLIDVDGVSEFHMTRCLMYQSAYNSGPVANFIDFGNNGIGCHGINMHDNHFTMYDGARSASIISVNGNADRVNIRDNVFEFQSFGSLGGAGIWINSPANYICRDNRYVNFASTTKEVLPNNNADHYSRGELTLSLNGQPAGGETGMTLLLNKTGSPILAKVKVGPTGSAGSGRRALYIDN